MQFALVSGAAIGFVLLCLAGTAMIQRRWQDSDDDAAAKKPVKQPVRR